jgi:hypothetical protein
LSESELKTKFDDPLTIILEPYSGPIVHYSFSGNVNDESGNDYNGTAYNITYTSDAHGNINSSAQFNGDAYIQLPSDFDLKERTISLMFNCNGFFLNPPYNYTVNNIFTIDHPGLVYGDLYFNILYVGADLSLEFVSNVASSDATNAKYVKININQWYHAVISIDKQYIKYYLNGTISGVYANTNPDYHSSSGTNNVLLGTSRTKANNYFQGKIDDLRIYNRALSAGEILSLYNEMK